ncbi:hypothetical protein ANN_10254 [Periplaneta americana]|uniref:Reverse transcriptase domain-containing protein n=1 Tax=Periplaneta americana TaxID=6978 RepID=A0ABQ8TNL2_PERAM|nr:hypothetical protein ANN_10254 [Periplaneta americana]
MTALYVVIADNKEEEPLGSMWNRIQVAALAAKHMVDWECDVKRNEWGNTKFLHGYILGFLELTELRREFSIALYIRMSYVQFSSLINGDRVDTKCKIRYHFSSQKINGVDHLLLSAAKVHLDPKRMYIHLDNLFNGDKRFVKTPSVPRDYDPLSILPTLSKALERIIHKQLSDYLNENNILNPYQSDFRADHSTATAIVKVTEDILQAMDNSKRLGAGGCSVRYYTTMRLILLAETLCLADTGPAAPQLHMPRERGHYSEKYSKDDLRAAVGSVLTYRASKKYNVPFNNLKRFLYVSSGPDDVVFPKKGRPLALTVEEEQKVTGDLWEAAEEYHRRQPDQPTPYHGSIGRLMERFKTAGSIHDKKRSGEPRSATGDAKAASQDGTPPHFRLTVRELLNEVIPGRWIDRRDPVEWPPKLPDLTPLDFFLWGHLKSVVYSNRPRKLDELQGQERMCTNNTCSVT